MLAVITARLSCSIILTTTWYTKMTNYYLPCKLLFTLRVCALKVSDDVDIVDIVGSIGSVGTVGLGVGEEGGARKGWREAP